MKAILIVEDDDATRMVIREALIDVDGWVALGVGNAAELLKALDSVRPALVVLDQHLPGIGGLELYDRLRSRPDTRAVPVLFVSGAAPPPDHEQLTGLHAWLAKPFDLDDLMAAVAALLGEPVPVL